MEYWPFPWSVDEGSTRHHSGEDFSICFFSGRSTREYFLINPHSSLSDSVNSCLPLCLVVLESTGRHHTHASTKGPPRGNTLSLNMNYLLDSNKNLCAIQIHSADNNYILMTPETINFVRRQTSFSIIFIWIPRITS